MPRRVTVIGGGIWFVTARYAANIHRIDDVFGGVDQTSRLIAASA